MHITGMHITAAPRYETIRNASVPETTCRERPRRPQNTRPGSGQGGPQRCRRRLRVLGLADGLADRDAPRPRRPRLADGVAVDAAQSESRQRGLGDRLADELRPRQFRELLRAGRERRPDTDITRAVAHRLTELVEVVRAHADQHLRPDDAPRLLHRQILLADV